jgi:hypothetical protein
MSSAMGTGAIMAKVHRRNLVQEMQTRTPAEPVRMAGRLGIESVRRRQPSPWAGSSRSRAGSG